MAEIANEAASISDNKASIFQINTFQLNRMPAKPTCQELNGPLQYIRERRSTAPGQFVATAYFRL